MTDFRALCEELVEELEVWIGYGDEADCADAHAVVDRARAALAKQPVEPTDEELDEFAVFWWGSDTDERTVTDVIECCSMAAFARAVLARWGQP
jgi:hypothetical protein